MLPNTRFVRVHPAVASGWPDITNTGTLGTSLTNAAGFTASTNGATYTAKNFTGNVDVTGTGITFNSCKVNGGLFYAVHIESGASATFNDCDIFGTVAGVTPCYISGGTGTFNRCHLFDGDSQLLITSGSYTATDCLFDDFWGRNTLATGGRSVSDGVTTNGSTTISSTNMAFVAGDVGHPIWGAGIPTQTSIVSVAAPNAVLDRACTATASGVTFTTNAQNPDGNHTECLKFTVSGGSATGTVNHCSLWARWGSHGSNGGGITGCFHNSGGTISVDNSRLILVYGTASYTCYFVNSYTGGSVTNSRIDHYDDLTFTSTKDHQRSDDLSGPAITWSGNVWDVDSTVCP